MTINVAVIGAGYWGPNLIRNFDSLESCRLKSICDLDPSRLAIQAEKFPQTQMTTRLQDILEDRDIQAVAIATPAESHRKLAEVCLRAGKHIFIEKPLAASVRDAKAIVELSEKCSRILMVGHIFLYDAALDAMIERIRQGEIGPLCYASGIRTSMAGTARLDTNIVWDALVHDAYILPELFGTAPLRVQAVGGSYLNPALEDVAFVNFDFGEGRISQVYVSWYALEKARRITLVGRKGILQYDDLAPDRLVQFARRYEQGQECDPQGRLRWHWKDNGAQVIPLAKAEPLKAECQHFIDCVEQNCNPRTNGKSGWRAVQILEACQRSLENQNTWMEITEND